MLQWSDLFYFVLGLTQSFAELAINIVVEVDRYPNPNAVQEDKDEPEVLDFVVRAERRGPVLGVRGWADMVRKGRVLDSVNL